MNKQLMVLNIILTVGDIIVCCAAIALFGWAAWAFGKWWILLFNFIPLGLYSNHSLVIEADITQAKTDELKPKGKTLDDK